MSALLIGEVTAAEIAAVERMLAEVFPAAVETWSETIGKVIVHESPLDEALMAARGGGSAAAAFGRILNVGGAVLMLLSLSGDTAPSPSAERVRRRTRLRCFGNLSDLKPGVLRCSSLVEKLGDVLETFRGQIDAVWNQRGATAFYPEAAARALETAWKEWEDALTECLLRRSVNWSEKRRRTKRRSTRN